MMKWALTGVLNVLLLFGAKSPEFASEEPPGPLSRFHAGLSNPDDCHSCHSPDGDVDHKRCLGCHTEMSRRIGAGRGFHRDKDEFCFACHVEHQGETAELIEWNPETFDHSETGFDLTGFHGRIGDCRHCHVPSRSISKRSARTYLLKDARCITCHQDEHAGVLGEDCSGCHRFDVRFEETRFDHGSTRFSLTGGHVGVDCADCHRSLPAGVRDMGGNDASRCSTCHLSAHSSRMSVCTQCHTTEEWRVRTW